VVVEDQASDVVAGEELERVVRRRVAVVREPRVLVGHVVRVVDDRVAAAQRGHQLGAHLRQRGAIVVGQQLEPRQEVLLVQHLGERRGVADVRHRGAVGVDPVADRAERMVERHRHDVQELVERIATPGSTSWNWKSAGTASSGIGKNSCRVMPPITCCSSSAAVSSA
jgi:hypothetical protein